MIALFLVSQIWWKVLLPHPLNEFVICTLLSTTLQYHSYLVSQFCWLINSPIRYWILSLCKSLAKLWWHKDKQNTICSQVVHSLGAELQWNRRPSRPEPSQPECDLGSRRIAELVGFTQRRTLYRSQFSANSRRKLSYLSTGGRGGCEQPWEIKNRPQKARSKVCSWYLRSKSCSQSDCSVFHSPWIFPLEDTDSKDSLVCWTSVLYLPLFQEDRTALQASCSDCIH